MLLYFALLGNLLEQVFQAIDRRKAGNALAHPGVDLASSGLGEGRRQVAELGPGRDHHGVRQIALSERASPAPQLRRRPAKDQRARRPLVLLQRDEQRRVPSRLFADGGMKLRERALGSERVARLAGEKVQALQGERRHAVSRRRGVVVAGLGAVDQPLVIVAGEEEPAVLLVLELLEQHLGEVLAKSERARVEFRLQELQERGEEIGI